MVRQGLQVVDGARTQSTQQLGPDVLGDVIDLGFSPVCSVVSHPRPARHAGVVADQFRLSLAIAVLDAARPVPQGPALAPILAIPGRTRARSPQR